ncbi:MAG: hypothetical protein WAW12_10825, partial [Pseudomonas sp.]
MSMANSGRPLRTSAQNSKNPVQSRTCARCSTRASHWHAGCKEHCRPSCLCPFQEVPMSIEATLIAPDQLATLQAAEPVVIIDTRDA